MGRQPDQAVQEYDRIDQKAAMAPWGGKTKVLGTNSWSLGALHGTIRERTPLPWFDPERPDPASPENDVLVVRGVPVRRGSRVRLHPGSGTRRTDAQDLFVQGRTALVRVVLHDVDGGEHLGVTVEDDPAADLLDSQGRYLYFDPDEVEPL